MTEPPSPAQPASRTGIQGRLILGLLTLLPLAVVWFVLNFLIGFLSWIGRPIVEWIMGSLDRAGVPVHSWMTNEVVVTTLAVIVALWLIYIVGAIASNVLGARLIAMVSGLVNRIPLVRTVYGAAQKLVQSLTTKPSGGQRVVLLPFPNDDMRAIGFVTKTFHDETTGDELAAVYVPTSPNPTSGYLEIVPLSKCTATDLTVDQAMNMILSGGATAPDHIKIGAKLQH